MRATRFNGSGSTEPPFPCPMPFDARSVMMEAAHFHSDLGVSQGGNRESEEFVGSFLKKSNHKIHRRRCKRRPGQKQRL